MGRQQRITFTIWLLIAGGCAGVASDEAPAAEPSESPADVSATSEVINSYDGPATAVPEAAPAEEPTADLEESAGEADPGRYALRRRTQTGRASAGYGGGGAGLDDAVAARGARARRRSPSPAATGGAFARPGRPASRPASPAAARPAPAPRALPQNAVLSSTFVGGSGAQARLEDLLDRGVMVDGQNVRLEAFEELGTLPYPRPASEAVGLHAELERTRLRTEGERVHLQIALMARQGERPARPRMDVRLVLDRSGSMHGDKWDHAVAAAHQLVDRLQPGDTFGLISYSDDATVDLQPARVGSGQSAHQAIRRLSPGGGTNIEAALRAADRVAPRRRQMNDVLLVVLVSDGVANIGQTNAQRLGELARGTFDRRGALTTTIGLGTDFDEDTMLSIAREGSGSYHFVRRSGDIGDILQDELEERAQAVAQGLRLRIELADGVTATRVYGSRVLEEQEAARVRRTEVATDRRLAAELGIARDRQQDEDRGLRIHLPTFRRGDQHVVLMELQVPRGTDTSRIAQITLDYKDLLSRGNRTARVEVEADRTRDAEAATASTQRTVKRTVLAFAAGDALRASSEALSRGDVSGARQILAERQRVLSAGARLWNDEALARDADLLARYDRVLGGAWNGWDGQSRRTMVLAMNFYGGRRMH